VEVIAVAAIVVAAGGVMVPAEARAVGLLAANTHEILLKVGCNRRCNDEVAASRDQRVGRNVVEQTSVDNSLIQMNDRQGKG
jgi:hypothetical protein